MKCLAPLWKEFCLRYYRWALREIDPLHVDVPWIVLQINKLEKS